MSDTGQGLESLGEMTGRPAMSRISERALVRLVRDRTWFQTGWPLVARRAMTSPDEKGAMTVSPLTEGLEARRTRAGSMMPR